MLIEEKDIK